MLTARSAIIFDQADTTSAEEEKDPDLVEEKKEELFIPTGNWWSSTQLSQYADRLSEAANRKPSWAAEGERAALRAVERARSQWKGVESRAMKAMLHFRRVIDDEVERLRSLRLEREDVEAKRRGLFFLDEQCAESSLDTAKRIARWIRKEAELLAVGFSDEEDSSIDNESESTNSEDTEKDFSSIENTTFDKIKQGDLSSSATTNSQKISARRLRESSSWLKRRALLKQAKKFNQMLGPYPAVDAFLNAAPSEKSQSDLANRALCETPQSVVQRIFICLGSVYSLAIGTLVCRAWRNKLGRSSPNNRRLWKWILRFGKIPPTGTMACRNLWLSLAADRRRNAIFDEFSNDPVTSTSQSDKGAVFYGETHSIFDLVLSMEEEAAFEEREGDDDIFDNPLAWWRSAQRRQNSVNARKWDSAIAVDAARTPLARLWRGIPVPKYTNCNFEDASPEILAPYRAAVASACGRIARKYPNVGYCQGLDYLVAFALRASCLDTDLAVTLVQALLDHLELGELFAPGLPGLKRRCRELRLLVDARCPQIAQRLREHALAVDLFAAPWLQTLFVYVDALPIAVLDRLWTLLLFERSFKPLHRVALALFVTIEPKLLAICHSPHHTLLFLSRLTSAEAHKKRRKASTRNPNDIPSESIEPTQNKIPAQNESNIVDFATDKNQNHPPIKQDSTPQYSSQQSDRVTTRSSQIKSPRMNPLEDDEDVIATDEETFCKELLHRAMNIKVTNAMLYRINTNAALPKPLRIRGMSDKIPNSV